MSEGPDRRAPLRRSRSSSISDDEDFAPPFSFGQPSYGSTPSAMGVARPLSRAVSNASGGLRRSADFDADESDRHDLRGGAEDAKRRKLVERRIDDEDEVAFDDGAPPFQAVRRHDEEEEEEEENDAMQGVESQSFYDDDEEESQTGSFAFGAYGASQPFDFSPPHTPQLGSRQNTPDLSALFGTPSQSQSQPSFSPTHSFQGLSHLFQSPPQSPQLQDDEDAAQTTTTTAPQANTNAPPPQPQAPPFDWSGARPTRTITLPLGNEVDWHQNNGGTMTKAVLAMANTHGVTLSDTHTRGLAITAPQSALQFQPPKLNFAGHRIRQVLHHHSEVVRWHLERTTDPVATQEARDAELRRQQRAIADAASGKQKKPRKSSKTAAPPKTPRKAKAPVDPTVYKDPGDKGYVPVEVQSQYLYRNGQLSLAMSANQKASQDFMASMTQADIKQMYEDAAALDPNKSLTNARVSSAAKKMLELHAANLARDQLGKSNPQGLQEDPDDMARSEALASLALHGMYTVVKNTEDKMHAEQNLNKDYEVEKAKADLRGEDTSKDEKDVAGTYIRCGACSTMLGPDDVYTHIHDRTDPKGAPHKAITGNAYAKQMTPQKFGVALQDYSRGRTMDTKTSERARSTSPPPRRINPYPPAPANPLAPTGNGAQANPQPRSTTTTTTSQQVGGLPPTPSLAPALPQNPPPVTVKPAAKKAGGKQTLLSFKPPQ